MTFSSPTLYKHYFSYIPLSKAFFHPPLAGIISISEAKTVCAGSEKFYKMCESNEVRFKLYQVSNNWCDTKMILIANCLKQNKSCTDESFRYMSKCILQISGCSPQTTAMNTDSALTYTPLNYCLTLCLQALLCLWRIFLFECKLCQILNRPYCNVKQRGVTLALICFSATARHDFSPVHLRPCWSRSCCYCNGETMKEKKTTTTHL